MGKITTIWNQMGTRQKIAAGALGSAFLAWAVGKCLDYLSGLLPSLLPLAMITHWLGAFVLNPYIEGGVIASVLIGFGPNVWDYFRRVGPKGCLQLIGNLALNILVVGGVAWVLWWLASSVYAGIYYTPRLFTPSQNSHGGPSKTAKNFVKKSPDQIEKLFKQNTDLTAHQILQSDFGKWMAVTGIIIEIKTADNYRGEDLVLMSEAEMRIGVANISTATLDFDMKWADRLARMHKGDRVYAICKLTDATDDLIALYNCELAAP